jgi:hypothetical protein
MSSTTTKRGCYDGIDNNLESEDAMTMTIDELVAQAARLPSAEQEQLVQRLIALRGVSRPPSVLPPGTPGSVWLANWEQVRIAPADADEIIRIIEEECERVDPNDWQ